MLEGVLLHKNYLSCKWTLIMLPRLTRQWLRNRASQLIKNFTLWQSFISTKTCDKLSDDSIIKRMGKLFELHRSRFGRGAQREKKVSSLHNFSEMTKRQLNKVFFSRSRLAVAGGPWLCAFVINSSSGLPLKTFAFKNSSLNTFQRLHWTSFFLLFWPTHKISTLNPLYNLIKINFNSLHNLL
jgi:hypothetical protein